MATNQNDLVLASHLFFQCFTGKKIAQYLTEKLRESNKFVDKDKFICLAIGGASELLRNAKDNYTIRFLVLKDIPEEARTKQFAMISKDGLSAFFNVDSLSPPPDDFTNFTKYKSILDEQFSEMLAGAIDIVIDYDGAQMLMPKVWFASSKKKIEGLK